MRGKIMLFEYGTPHFLRGSTEHVKEQVNGAFITACDNKDISTLEAICASREVELLDDEVVSAYASLSIRDDTVEVLKFMFQHFPRVDLDVENFLATSVSHRAEECFKYLVDEQDATVDSLEYYCTYNRALQMQNELYPALSQDKRLSPTT
ncbi:MAG: hypothetical protein JKY54_11860 [Flavobacteriales bacterium]|nr:hypothetical protein [Flavobacteriales bacterium]